MIRIALLLLLVSPMANAAIYKCTAGGKTNFQDRPCESSNDQKIIEKPAEKRTAASQGGHKRVLLTETPDKTLIDACLDIFRPKLRDPRGAYADGGVFQQVSLEGDASKPPWREVVVSGRATNGYGGYVAKNFHCIVDSENKIDAKGTEMYQALFTLGIDPS